MDNRMIRLLGRITTRQRTAGSTCIRFRSNREERNGAFTLVELLAVLAIIGIMTLLLMPSIGGIVSSSDMDRAINDISLTIAQARSYALAHQTYVYLGFEETDSSQAATPYPQAQVTSPAVGGRIYMAAVATTDGTSGSTPYQTSGWSDYHQGSNLVQILKPEIFNNIHLVDNAPNTGNSIRPPNTGSSTTIPQLVDNPSPNTFTLPLGNPPGAGQFTDVIQIDPQGAITLAGAFSPWIELGLVPTHGKTVPAAVVNYAAIQIEGTTGAVRVYRP